ncbi:MAG TPA: hypothetical protein VFY79_03730 [Dehalococcoidia bacterium]|nr:hypothetical protein [Dehalococcoidia bacterium]
MPQDETTPDGEHGRAPDDSRGAPPASADEGGSGDGYEYDAAGPPARSGPSLPLLFAIAAIVPAVIVGLAVWFFVGGGSGSSHSSEDVASVLNAFTTQQGTTSTRFEGTVPPNLPKGLPVYPGSQIVSSLQQVTGTDVSYLIVYDTSDDRATVGKYFEQKLAADPWELTGGQNDENGVLHQFDNTSDPNVTGLVLVASSKNEKVTTILESVTVAAGAASLAQKHYDPGTDFALPATFPSNVPKYPGSTTVESAYRKQAQGDSFAVSFVTKDGAQKALDFYRQKLTAAGYTVTDGSAAAPGSTPEAGATPAAATSISFTDASGGTNGQISTSTVEEDSSYTRIDVQLGLSAAPPTSGSSTPPASGTPPAGG